MPRFLITGDFDSPLLNGPALWLVALLLATTGCAASQTPDEPPASQSPTGETTAEASAPDAEADEDDENGEDDADEEDAAGQAEARGGRNDTTDRDGLGARLADFDYPYEVSFFEVQDQRQTLEMAYMDVKPDEQTANGHTVLLLHGKNFSGAYWGRTIKALVDRGYRVVAPDQIGFGKSAKPKRFQFSFQTLATYTKNLLDKRGVDRASVVGHSMGGMLAARFALMFPDFTEKLALVNPIGLEDWKRTVPYLTVQDWYERELQKTPAKIKAYMKKNYFDGEWKSAYDPLVEIQAGWATGPDKKRTAWVSALTYDMIFTQPVVHEFGDLEVHTLLLIGQRDRTALGKGLVKPEVAETLGRYPKLGQAAHEAIPTSKLVELDDVGHVPHFEAWDRYIKHLTDFLPAEDPKLSNLVRGSLDKDVIRRVIRNHRQEIKYCYEKRLLDVPDLAGQVKVRFTIQPDGQVSDSFVTEASLQDEQVHSCMNEAIEGWRYPSPRGGGIVKVNYPFNLTVQRAGKE